MLQAGQRLGIGPDVDTLLHRVTHHAQIIDAVSVIGMVVRKEDAVKRIGTHAQQLLTQVGRCIDQNARALAVGGSFDKRCASPPSVLGIGGVTGTPHGPNARHTA